jgi:hypothetical protein
MWIALKFAQLRLWYQFRTRVSPVSSWSSDLLFTLRARLGNSAIFLIGGITRDVEPVPILLRSGDIVIMSGPACRRAYHGSICPPPAFLSLRLT